MAYCKKCGAYIPIDETTCPACGYDPYEEARQAREAAAAAQQAQEEAERKKKEADSFAAQEKKREEEARRRAEEQRARQQQKTGQSSGAYQTQYTSQRTGQSSAAQGQYASQRTGSTWSPPWSEGSTSSQSSTYDYERMRTRAQESVQNQRLSVLSYIWPLAIIPLVLRNKDDFARYHSNQGLVLLLAMGLGSTVAGIFGSGFLAAVVELFGLYCTVKGIINVIRGKKEPLPLIGGIKLLK